ncbi:hypothetical protein KDK77_00995 [bacterium]|nr:hypothetical protein [bacterium]
MKQQDTRELFERLKKHRLPDEQIVWNGLSDRLKDTITRIPVRHKRYKTMRASIAAAAVIMLLCAYGVYMSGIIPYGVQQASRQENGSWYFNDTLSDAIGNAEEILLTALNESDLSFDERINELESVYGQISQPIW